MAREGPLVQVSRRGQITLPASVRKSLGLQDGDALRINVVDGNVVLEPVAVVPIEVYDEDRVQEFERESTMTEEELARAQEAWGVDD